MSKEYDLQFPLPVPLDMLDSGLTFGLARNFFSAFRGREASTHYCRSLLAEQNKSIEEQNNLEIRHQQLLRRTRYLR
jgi:hypothetical protein